MTLLVTDLTDVGVKFNPWQEKEWRLDELTWKGFRLQFYKLNTMGLKQCVQFIRGLRELSASPTLQCFTEQS